MKIITEKRKKEGCHQFQLLLNVFGQIFLVPFHIKLEEKTGSCYFRTNIFHQIICLISHLLALTMEIWSMFGLFQSKDISSSITRLFDVVCNFAATSLALITLKMYWFQRAKILALLESTKASFNSSLQGKLKPVIAVVVLTRSFLLIWQLLEYSGGISKFFRIREEMYMWHAPGAEVSSSLDTGNSTMTNVAVEIAKGILTRVIIILAGNSSNLFLLFHLQFFMLGLSMKQIGKDFRLELESTKDDVHKGVDAYLCLRGKVDRINQILGSSLFCYYITIMSYLVTGPEILSEADKHHMAEYMMLLYAMFSLFFWVITANYHDQLQYDLGGWLRYQIFQNSKSIQFSSEVRMKLGSIKSEVDSGLQAFAISAGYFRITNTFLSTIMGVLTTYSIIIFQTQSNKRD